jgi:hypothetical protein
MRRRGTRWWPNTGNLVYSAPVRYCMPPRDAADVFQEVRVDLATALKNHRQPGALRTWLLADASRGAVFYREPSAPYAEAKRMMGLAGGSIGLVRGRCLQNLRYSLGERGV